MAIEPSNSRQYRWDAYLVTERQGSRTEKLAALDEFVDELYQSPQQTWEQWAIELAATIVDDEANIPVRRQLFERVLFPALAAGLEGKSAGCARWLAGLAQHLYRCPACKERLGAELSSEWALLERAIVDDPDDRRSRRRLIELIANHFEYALHEIPSGVLYGTNGATVSQCDELLTELVLLRSLLAREGCAEEFPLLVENCELHFNAYKGFLLKRLPGETYAEHLRQRSNMPPSK